MFVAAPRWAPLLPYLRDRHGREATDRCAAEAVNWRRHEPALPDGLELQWLGTSGFRLSCQGTHLLVDPYLSRASLATVARGRTLLPSPSSVAQYVKAADAVLVGHTHFDHAVDAPLISRRHDCPVYGSRSMRRLMALHGVASRAIEVAPHRSFTVGPFEVTFVPSAHSRLLLGLAVLDDGELTCGRADRLTRSAYRSGQVYAIHIAVAGVTFYHQGSANLVDEEVRHRGVDFFLACIAGRASTPRYWERVLPRLRPRVIVPHHFDDFFRPLDARPGFSLNVGFAAFLDEVRAVDPDLAIRALDPLQVVRGP